MKSLIQAYFYYSKFQRRGIIVLLAVLIVVILLNLFLPYLIPEPKYSYIDWPENRNTSLINNTSVQFQRSLFDFDPNTLTIEQGIKLGFSESQLNSLVKYRNKGGKFFHKSDFKKMYFVNDSIYNELEAYIIIPDSMPSSKPSAKKLRQFYFCPNNLPNDYWRKLGLKKWQIKVINNYEKKVKPIETKEELKQVYGLDSVWFSDIQSFVVCYNKDEYLTIRVSPKSKCGYDSVFVINNQYCYGKFFNSQSAVKAKNIVKDSCDLEGEIVWVKSGKLFDYSEVVDFSIPNSQQFKEKKVLTKINLNSADSITLMKLKGVGSVLAGRIVKYREKLGGFRNDQQLTEVYGVTDKVVEINKERLIIDSALIQLININEADYFGLVKHPYVNSNLANALINYRKAHGFYRNVEDIKGSFLVNEELYTKIAPYLKVN